MSHFLRARDWPLLPTPRLAQERAPGPTHALTECGTGFMCKTLLDPELDSRSTFWLGIEQVRHAGPGQPGAHCGANRRCTHRHLLEPEWAANATPERGTPDTGQLRSIKEGDWIYVLSEDGTVLLSPFFTLLSHPSRPFCGDGPLLHVLSGCGALGGGGDRGRARLELHRALREWVGRLGCGLQEGQGGCVGCFGTFAKVICEHC